MTEEDGERWIEMEKKGGTETRRDGGEEGDK